MGRADYADGKVLCLLFWGEGVRKGYSTHLSSSLLTPHSVLLETLPRDPVVDIWRSLLLSGHLATLALPQAGPSLCGVMEKSQVSIAGDAGCVHGWPG